jgi:hypothetical protein
MLTAVIIFSGGCEMRQERLDMSAPAWLKESLRELALKKGVSLSDYIRDVLKAHVAKELEKKEG